MGEKAASLGFDWEKPEDVFAKVEEELAEVKEAAANQDQEALTEEIGDLLFSVSSLARKYKVQPEPTLKRALKKFQTRFHDVEKEILQAQAEGKTLTPKEMDQAWERAKERQA